MNDPLNLIREAYRNVQALMQELDSFGAQDSEPVYYLASLIASARGGENPVPEDPDWELYNLPGYEQAASRLSEAAQQLIDAIGSVPLFRQREVIELTNPWLQ